MRDAFHSFCPMATEYSTVAIVKHSARIRWLIEQMLTQVQLKRQQHSLHKLEVDTINEQQVTKCVTFDIGGHCFTTRQNTITEDNNNLLSFLTQTQPLDSAIFIDRDPTFFACVLQFMRSYRDTRSRIVLCAHVQADMCKPIHREARFYGLQVLEDLTVVPWPDTTFFLLHYLKDPSAAARLRVVTNSYTHRPHCNRDVRGCPFLLLQRPVDAVAGKNMHFVITSSQYGREYVWCRQGINGIFRRVFLLPFTTSIGRRFSVDSKNQFFAIGHASQYHNKNTNAWRYKYSHHRWRVSALPPLDCAHPHMEVCAGMGRVFVVAGFQVRELIYNNTHWCTLPEPPVSLRFSTAVILNEEVYYIGGQDDKGPTGNFLKWSPVTRSWTQLPKLLQPRWRCCVRIYSGVLMVFGGGCTSVEVFLRHRWVQLPSMHALPNISHLVSIQPVC